MSIIIPVYNGEKVLRSLVDTILSSNSKDFELIIVNDGSVDQTSSIIEEYKNTDNRCIVINKKNEGVSAARNDGILASHGEYVYFCDCDDELDMNVFENICLFLKYNHVDILLTDFVYKFNYDREDQRSSFDLKNDIIMTKSEIDKKLISPLVLLNGTDLASIWNKFFSKAIIDNHKIQFENSVHKGEDWRFVLDFLSVANSALYFAEILYIYNVFVDTVESKYKYELGTQTLGSVKRKIEINRTKKLNADKGKVYSWYLEQLRVVIDAVNMNLDCSVIQEMVNDWSVVESSDEILKLTNKELLYLEIPRRYWFYAFFIKHKLMWILKVLTKL